MRVWLVDDNLSICRGLHLLLSREQDVEVLGYSTTAEDAIIRVGQSSPDVVLLDVDLPPANGIETGREILRRSPATRLLMVSADDRRETIASALAMGASGYFAKHRSWLQLPTAVREVAAGRTYLALVGTVARTSSQQANRPRS